MSFPDLSKLKNSHQKNRSGPPSITSRSVQLSIFSEFFSNDDSSVSNAIQIWEQFPKYYFSSQRVRLLRNDDGLATPFEWEKKINGDSFRIRINPASIEDADGHYKSHFPGPVEELVEEALKKILTLQNHGIHLPEKQETWVRFSYRQLMSELGNMGHKIKLSRIKQAIDIMGQCIISVYQNSENEPIYRGPILADIVRVSRKDYTADSSARNMARLPIFITQSINSLEYRQFNYERYMRFSSQLSRWLYKQLIHQYTNASMMNSYHIALSNIQDNSALLQMANVRDRRIHCEKSLDELVSVDILREWRVENVHREGRKITNVIYNLLPHGSFISEQKAANARVRNAKEVRNSPKLVK